MASPGSRGIAPGLAFGLIVALLFTMAGTAGTGAVLGAGCALLIALGLACCPPRSRLPWLGLLVPLLFLPEIPMGAPHPARLGLAALLGMLAVGAARWLERITAGAPEAPFREVVRGVGPAPGNPRRFDRLVVVTLLLYTLAAWAAVSWKFAIFGDRFIAQDTAYFEQGFWGYVTGRSFFQASSQGWWRYDPPLTSHFAMHFSPVMLVIAELYRLWPSYHLLHLTQVLAITASAIPIYLLVRRFDPFAGLFFTLAYLANAAVIAQTQGAFHELAFAAPAVAFAVYFFFRQRLYAFLGCLALAIAAREDLALLAFMAGGAALLSRAPRAHRAAWVVLPMVVGVSGWVIAGRVMAVFGANGTQVIEALFSRFGSSREEILAGMIRDPGAVVAMLFEAHRPRYLLALFRPGLMAALASPLSLLVAPVLAVNLLVRGAGTAWLDVHYCIYLPAVLMPASIAVWLAATPAIARWAGCSNAAARGTLAALMGLSSLLSLPDVLGPEDLRAYLEPVDRAEIEAIVAAIPPDASVAVPRHLTPALAKRERLYMVNRWADYTRYDPEYLVVERDLARLAAVDQTLPQYAAYAQFLAGSPRMEVVMRLPHYILYRDRSWGSSTPPAGETTRMDGEGVHP